MDLTLNLSSMPYKNKTAQFMEDWKIEQEKIRRKDERTYTFTKCEKGKQCEYFTVYENDLTQDQLDILFERLSKYYSTFPSSIQERFKDSIK